MLCWFNGSWEMSDVNKCHCVVNHVLLFACHFGFHLNHNLNRVGEFSKKFLRLEIKQFGGRLQFCRVWRQPWCLLLNSVPVLKQKLFWLTLDWLCMNKSLKPFVEKFPTKWEDGDSRWSVLEGAFPQVMELQGFPLSINWEWGPSWIILGLGVAEDNGESRRSQQVPRPLWAVVSRH